MRKKLMVALEEELEVEKLHESEQLANKLGEAAILYDNVKKDKVVEDNKEAADTNTEEETPTDSSDASTEETPTEDTETTEDSASLESLRNMTYSSEGFGDAVVSVVDAGRATAGYIAAAVAAIAYVGVTVGPTVIKSFYKGVLYTFGKLAKLLHFSYVTLDKYIQRRTQSFEKIKNEIGNLKKALDVVKDKDTDLSEMSYANQRVINNLKISDSTDFTKNLQVLDEFVKNVINQLNIRINNDIHSVKYMISNALIGSGKIPNTLLSVKPLSLGLTQGTVEGYVLGNEFTDTYNYPQRLPSDIAFIVTSPKPDLSDLGQITEAYNGSTMILGIDMESFKEINQANYMTPNELSSFLDSLEKLCDVCIQHQKLYETVHRSKEHLKINYKNYFFSLANSKEKVTMRDSLVEHVYLKSMFVDKVYLVAAMDIHDYVTKVMSSALSYAHENIKKLS